MPRSANIQLVEMMKSQRVSRRPQHRFYLHQVPFTIQPHLIAPVLPGETMDSLIHQSRVVTDPISNPVIGWWCEYYYFYVKLRDLDDSDTFEAMFIDPDTTTSALKDSDDVVQHYYNPSANNELNYVEMCLKRVTEEYFRDQDEAWNNITISNLPVAGTIGNSLLDSFINDDAFQTSIEPTIDTSGANVGISVIEAAMRQWEMLKLDNMTDMTFNDYLKTYGVNLPSEEDNKKPELIRFLREWSYPSSTIDPADGSPVSAVSWAISDRADKKRFFKEPGFIFGVTCIRPKIYFGTQSTYGAAFLDDLYTWLPAVLNDDPATSLKEFAAGTGPFKTNSDDYWLDMKDLFIHGDQFMNIAPSTAGTNCPDLPTAGGIWKYPSNQAMLDEFFVSANAICKVDGIVSLNIRGRLTDTS
jgi:hypothetical protein